MIRILTSLVAVLTVASIQSQTSVSQLSMLLSGDRTDQLLGMHIEEMFKHSLSQKDSIELCNGGFISSYNENLDILFTNTSIFFFHKDFYNSYQTPNLKTIFGTTSKTVENNKIIQSLVSFLEEGKASTFKSINYRNNHSVSSSYDNITKEYATEFVNIDTQYPQVFIKHIKYDFIYPLVIRDTSKVLRIRSPNFDSLV